MNQADTSNTVQATTPDSVSPHGVSPDSVSPDSVSPDSVSPLTARRDWAGWFNTLTPIVALVALVFFCSARSNTFLEPQNLINVLKRQSDVGIIAIGMTLVIISGGIDLSVGSLMALAASFGMLCANAAIIRSDGTPILDSATAQIAHVLQALHLVGGPGKALLVGTAAALLIGLIGGLLSGVAIAKGRVPAFIATLGFMAIFRSLARSIGGDGTINAVDNAHLEAMGRGIMTPLHDVWGTGHVELPWLVIAFVGVAILSQGMLSFTRFGRYLIAIGSNERSAVYSAIAVSRVKMWAYGLLGLCVGLAAILRAASEKSVSTTSTGVLYELDAIAAVVIGGTRLQGGYGSIWRTIIGVLILGVVRNMLVLLGVADSLHGLVEGCIIIAAVLLQRVGRAADSL